MSTNGKVKELNTEIILPPSYYLRQGKKEVPGLSDLSFQRRAETANTSGVYSWWFARYDDGSEISPYWSEQRDRDLREFYLREGNDILQGAVSSMVKWGGTLPWVVEGPDRVVRRYQSVLSESEFGQGWQVLIPKVLTDYYTQDKGATIEVIGAGNPDGALEGPVLGLAHLDAQFVQPTGDADYPILYLNTKDGKPHRIHYSRCIRIVDMPSPNELLCGVGFCAVSRVIASSQILLKLARYKNEKLSDMPEAGLLILNNLLPKQWSDAKAQHQRERRKLGQEIWSNIMTLFSIDPAQPATATLTSFANLPEGFDELVSTNLYVNIVALAFGVDPREFWPVSGGPLGTARESETMAQKAKGKGKGDIISNIERAINWRVLPESVSFRFDSQDDEEDKLRAEINELKVKSIFSMWKPESIGQGAELPVTALEIRQMLADNVPDYFKREFLEVQVTDEEELTDTEREDKGAIVRVGHKGQVLETQRKRVNEVLKMAEENYKAGRISLDQLVEFKLGEVLDKQFDDFKFNSCHNDSDGKFCSTAGIGGGGGIIPSGIGPNGEIQNYNLPDYMQNKVDGSIGPSLMYHGTSNREYTFGSSSTVYITPQDDEALGYARDYHRFGEPPPNSPKPNRELLTVRRKPGAALSIEREVNEAIMNDDDIDSVVTQYAGIARNNNYRYLYFSHPSFAGNDVQDVVISLYPKEDLSITKVSKVKPPKRV